MIIPDVNLLLYAELAAFPEHRVARTWWETVLADEVVGLTSPALFGFLRIATNPRVFTLPLPIDDALARVRAWMARSNVRVLVPGPRYFEIAFDLLTNLGTAGNLTTDVQLAAYAIESSATLCSNDFDFGRFSGLAWKNPLAK